MTAGRTLAIGLVFVYADIALGIKKSLSLLRVIALGSWETLSLFMVLTQRA
jgi:hypothetical protein